MKNKLRIDLFLKQIQLLSQSSRINQKQIYVQLASLNVPEEERNINLSQVFENLQEINKNNDKTDVFVDQKWSYFCQFRSKHANHIYSMNPIKLYIPLRQENLEQSVQKIITYIEQNNIEHCSKLAKQIRNDNFVIRVSKKEDADKIIEFVNNDQELSLNTREPNPFCIQEGKVGLAMDRSLSYNTILSQYIDSYIKLCNEQKVFASQEGFKDFLNIQLVQLTSKDNLADYIKMLEYSDIKNLPKSLQTVKEITTLLTKVMDGEQKESLYEYFEKIQEDLEYDEESMGYTSGEYKDFDYVNLYNSGETLLKEIVNTMYEKYGLPHIRLALETYKNTGNAGYITRTDDLRNKVENSKILKTYISLIDIDGALNCLVPKVEVKETKSQDEIVLEEVCKSTYVACQTPEREYSGKTQVARSLIVMQQNNFDCVTRQNNARRVAKEQIDPSKIRETVIKTLVSNGYIIENEEDLYFLYATHIENLCLNNEKERGNGNARR